MNHEAASPHDRTRTSAASVVIRCGDRIIKGSLESPCWDTADDTLPNAPAAACDVFRVRRLDTDALEEIPAGQVSAVFFVSDFHGDPKRSTVRFHAHEPVLPGVWIQVLFPNGEVIEGVVENSVRFLVDPGFFLRPTDPGSNNKFVYVMKSAVVDHHVLGVTKL